MGFYINTNSKGERLGASFRSKDDGLIADGATITSGNEFEENLVCVVDNGSFAAAGYAFSESEYMAFAWPDRRQKVWLIYPPAPELSGFTK